MNLVAFARDDSEYLIKLGYQLNYLLITQHETLKDNLT